RFGFYLRAYCSQDNSVRYSENHRCYPQVQKSFAVANYRLRNSPRFADRQNFVDPDPDPDPDRPVPADSLYLDPVYSDLVGLDSADCFLVVFLDPQSIDD